MSVLTWLSRCAQILNSTGKVALNAEAIHRVSPEKLAARLPGRPQAEINITEGLRFAAKELERRELSGPIMATTNAHPSGAKTMDINFRKPEPVPTSGRDRNLKQEDKKKVEHPELHQTRLRASSPKADMRQSIVELDRCVSAPPVPEKKAKPSQKKRGKPGQERPTLPVFRGPSAELGDSTMAVNVKKMPKDVGGEYRFKYDRIHLPPYRASGNQITPFMNGFQHLTKCPKQDMKKPEPKDPKRVAKNVIIDLAEKVVSRINVRKTFRDFDEDRSGDLDYEEFRKGLEMLGFRVTDQEFKEVMKLLDVDGDGTIEYEEFCSKLGNTSMYDITEDVDDEDADRERTEGLLQKVWERVDEDGSGTLDRGEVSKVLIQMGFGGTGKKVLDAAMAEMDEDGSGEVDYEEFTAWFMKQDADKQANVPPTPHFKGVMEDDGIDRRDEWASDDEGADEDLFLNTQPLHATTGSLDDATPTRPGMRATIHKGHHDKIRIAKSFSTGDIDLKWKVPRSDEQKAATIYHVPELNSKQTSPTKDKGLASLQEQFVRKQSTIIAAFNDADRERSGVVGRKVFRNTLYKLNISMTKAQVDRVYSCFNADNALDYTEFCEDLIAGAPNTQTYSDIMEGAQRGLPYRQADAERLLPKCAVEPIVHHAAKPKMWYFWNSPCAQSTVWRHMAATDDNSPYAMTKDGRNPGSKLDFYERGTSWVKRHQDLDRKLVVDQQKARGERTRHHQERCKKTYYKSKRREDEKQARRTATFRIQAQRYEGSVRRKEQYGANPVLTKHLSYDMGSDMHCPRTRNTHRDDMHTQSHDLYQTVMRTEGHSTMHHTSQGHNGALEYDAPPMTETLANFATTSTVSGF